mmetsp:Transcript_5830/g.9966  ORF Transcript_5830/g.9966 Transcript_5830/m.9966 type:complete len:118 (-) Transcript_5830:655-1008(-)
MIQAESETVETKSYKSIDILNHHRSLPSINISSPEVNAKPVVEKELKINQKVSYFKTESEEESVGMRRQFQAVRDYILSPVQPKILENYMELVVQFGYVILFGQIFPLAPFFSMISN